MTAVQILAEYDVPHDGEGSPMGDVSPTCFDDDSILYSWTPILDQGCAFSVRTDDELKAALKKGRYQSATEVFQVTALTEDDSLTLLGGLEARRLRALDARSRRRIVWWSRNTA